MIYQTPRFRVKPAALALQANREFVDCLCELVESNEYTIVAAW